MLLKTGFYPVDRSGELSILDALKNKFLPIEDSSGERN